MYNISTECKKCKGSILVNAETIQKREVECENGKSIIITCFECPHCGERHIVQLDNDETNELLVKLTGKVARMARMKKNHMQMSKKEAAKVTKIRTDLADKRLELIKEFQGMTYKDGDNTYCLEVSVLNG